MDNILDLLGFFEDNAFEMNCSSATRMALFNLFLTWRNASQDAVVCVLWASFFSLSLSVWSYRISSVSIQGAGGRVNWTWRNGACRSIHSTSKVFRIIRRVDQGKGSAFQIIKKDRFIEILHVAYRLVPGLVTYLDINTAKNAVVFTNNRAGKYCCVSDTPGTIGYNVIYQCALTLWYSGWSLWQLFQMKNFK